MATLPALYIDITLNTIYIYMDNPLRINHLGTPTCCPARRRIRACVHEVFFALGMRMILICISLAAPRSAPLLDSAGLRPVFTLVALAHGLAPFDLPIWSAIRRLSSCTYSLCHPCPNCGYFSVNALARTSSRWRSGKDFPSKCSGSVGDHLLRLLTAWLPCVRHGQGYGAARRAPSCGWAAGAVA